ncbi:MAG: phosphoribosylformylglycinamidine synthase I [Candidatus Eremiobacteraeota bacterium]|nr:phosphoribosylformylglycinamidine synthase I [Candidatus Eremiobacteraeota bacterium]
MSARVAVVVFPGTNSEEETLRLARDVGMTADLVHWSNAAALSDFDAYILPGGFAYEDRIRAGAIAAHDRIMDAVIAGAQRNKLVLGICNGAQILLEAGLVPGTGPVRVPTAAFTRNAAPGKYICKRVEVRLTIDPARCAITSALAKDCVLPAWAAHGEGRLAASPESLHDLQVGNNVAFVYVGGAPNGSALDAAALTNTAGNVLAIMPHPEREGWGYNHLRRSRGTNALEPSGGAALFDSFAKTLRV